MSNIYFTQHAIERFIQRHAPEETFYRARTLLINRSQHAVCLKQKTLLGQTQWQVHNPSVVLVTKYDKGRHVCVTVLPQPENKDIPEEEAELIQEYIEEHSHELLEFEPGLASIDERLGSTMSSAQRFNLEVQRMSIEAKYIKAQHKLARDYLFLMNTDLSKAQDQIESMQFENKSSRGKRGALKKALKIALKCLFKNSDDPVTKAALAEIKELGISNLEGFWHRYAP